MPATSAATEKSFSTYGNFHSTKRIRLTTNRAGKLTFVAHNLKLLEARAKNKKQKRLDFTLEPWAQRAEESDHSDNGLENWSAEEEYIEDEDVEIAEGDMYDLDSSE